MDAGIVMLVSSKEATAMSDRELWVLLRNEKLNAEKVIHLYRSGFDPKHPWSILLENIIQSRSIRVYNVADSYDEGLVTVKAHLEEASRLGYALVEKRT